MAEGHEPQSDRIREVELTHEMRDSFMRFTLSVIRSRALPDVRDGLKPSQRRILVAMNDDNVGAGSQHTKCAAIVGSTMKCYHPHGDMPIYDTLVRMGQDFNARYPLVDKQGNFGSVDGDPAGAARYTEARLSRYAEEMLDDLQYETVDLAPTYDEKRQEPVVLPGRMPNLLCNGTAGIAVGYATTIPPHNLSEICDAACALLDDREIDPASLMRIVKGPDFPTGGIVLGFKGIRDYMSTGRGSITVQGRATIEPLRKDRQAIIVRELPYQVNKSRFLERIALLHQEKKIEGVATLRDESDRTGMRVVVEMRRDANPNLLLNQLYKHTDLRVTMGVNMVVLVDGVPMTLGVKALIEHFLGHRLDVILRRTRFLLERDEARLHIVEGLLKAIDIIDEIIAIIKKSRNRTEARERLQAEFDFSERQAQAIIEMQLGQLTGLDRERLESERQALAESIADYKDILGREERQRQVIKAELEDTRKRLGDERRTEVLPAEADDISVEDLIAREDVTITVTRDGYIKRLPVDTYRVQHRGGRGILALNKKEEDSVRHLFVATTHHLILCFTDRGRVYRMKAYDAPMASRSSRGTPIVNLVPVEPGEEVTATIPVEKFDAGGCLIMVTERGVVKKTELKAFDTALRARGLNAINLDEGDRLRWVMWTPGKHDIVIATRNGYAMRFDEDAVRSMGRASRGVRGIKLREGDVVVGTELVAEDDKRDMLVVSRLGLGKRTLLSGYPRKGRGTMGVVTLKITDKNGPIVGTQVVEESDEVMCITEKGILIRMPVNKIRRTGRSSQGVRLVSLDKGDRVSTVAKVIQSEEG